MNGPDAVLVRHPAVGSMWLKRCHEHDGMISGEVEAATVFGRPIYDVLTFPVGCIVKRSSSA